MRGPAVVRHGRARAPHDVGTNPMTNTAYVTNDGSDTVSVISG